jgi:hypothetical protein
MEHFFGKINRQDAKARMIILIIALLYKHQNHHSIFRSKFDRLPKE